MTEEYSYRSPSRRNVPRGTLLALLVVPIGIVAYTAIYQFGFIVSIIGFGIAWLAMTLYRVGSGAELDRTGAVRVTVITIGTVILSIAAGIVWDGATYWASQIDSSALASLVSSDFWDFLAYNFSDPGFLQQYLPDIVVGLLFGALGCFSTLRRAWMRTAPVSVRMPTAEDRAAFEAPSQPGERGAYGALADEERRDPTA